MIEKNIKKQEAKKQRCLALFNTGVRTMKSEKDYNRKKIKKQIKDYMKGTNDEF